MKTFIAALLAVSLFSLAANVHADHHGDKPTPKAVLVTGASSGIGAKITETLAANGYYVYAGARKQADLDRLDAMDNVSSVKLDVTKQDQIDAAVEFVRSQGRGLHGLVNNAGVAVIGPLIETPVEELEFQMNVNVTGVYRVTQAFAPLIIENKGRITTTGSISGILSGNLFGIYSMSKHAIEAFTDSLAQEMQRFDVKVSVVEPGNYKSEIGESFAKRFADKNYISEDSPYAQDMAKLAVRMDGQSQAKEPDEVAEAVMHAMFSESPKRRYMVTPNAREAEITIRQAMREMLQLNHDQPYTLDREALIKLLDEVSEEF